jgi:hypothetical protein
MILDFISRDLMIHKYITIILRTYNHISIYSDFISYDTMLYYYIII